MQFSLFYTMLQDLEISQVELECMSDHMGYDVKTHEGQVERRIWTILKSHKTDAMGSYSFSLLDHRTTIAPPSVAPSSQSSRLELPLHNYRLYRSHSIGPRVHETQILYSERVHAEGGVGSKR